MLCFAESHSVHNGGMHKFVSDNGIFRTQNRFEQSPVGIETRWEKDCIFHAQKFGQFLFQCFMDVLRAAYESDRTHAISPFIQPGVSCGDDIRMTGQTKVVVGTEVDNLCCRRIGRILHGNICLLW